MQKILECLERDGDVRGYFYNPDDEAIYHELNTGGKSLYSYIRYLTPPYVAPVEKITSNEARVIVEFAQNKMKDLSHANS